MSGPRECSVVLPTFYPSALALALTHVNPQYPPIHHDSYYLPFVNTNAYIKYTIQSTCSPKLFIMYS